MGALHETRFHETLPDGDVLSTFCPHDCRTKVAELLQAGTDRLTVLLAGAGVAVIGLPGLLLVQRRRTVRFHAW